MTGTDSAVGMGEQQRRWACSKRDATTAKQRCRKARLSMQFTPSISPNGLLQTVSSSGKLCSKVGISIH